MKIVTCTKCTWWDSIDKAKSSIVPICPFCNAPLLQHDEKVWSKGILSYDEEHPGYLDFLEYLKGQSFKSMKDGYKQFKLENPDSLYKTV